MKRYLITGATAVILGCSGLCASAQKTSGISPAQQQAAAAGATETEPDWSVNMDYAGFDFQIPAGTVVQKGSSFLAKYPDGSFGVSMTNIAKPGANQKIAFEVCRRMAETMKLPDPDVMKVKYGKCSGAKATGTIEGQQVTVVVLPYDDQEVTTVILAAPGRQEWVNNFLRTLKR